MRLVRLISLLILLTVFLASCTLFPGGKNNPPDQPSNPIPQNGAQNTPRDEVTLSWNCSDPDGDELRYDIFFGEDQENLDAIATSVEETYYVVKNLKPGTTYYWKVVARDDHGKSSESPVWSFKTSRSPDMPSNPTPSQGAYNISVDKVLLSWECSDPDGDELTFSVRFGENPSELQTIGSVKETSYEVENLKPGTTYYWQIVVDDGHGNTKYGYIWFFRTSHAPEEPSDPDPENGSENVSVVKVKLSWKCSDPDGDTLTYDLLFGENPDDLEELATSLENTSYEIRNLDSETTYYWRIVVHDGHGNSVEGPLWSFKTVRVPFLLSQKTYGGSDDEKAYFITPTQDGGYAITGFTRSEDGIFLSNHGQEDIWIMKMNEFGSVLDWIKMFGGSENDVARSAIQTSDGKYVLVGYTTSSDGDVSGNHGGSDVWIVKLDENGNMLWQRTLGGSGLDMGLSVIQDDDGNYVLVGYTTSNDGDVSGNHGEIDVWIVKLDENGNILWQKTLGGSIGEMGLSVVQADGGYILAGLTASNDGDVSGNHGYTDAWIVKLDKNGNILWQKTLGGSKADAVNSIIRVDGGFVAAGYTASSDGDVSENQGETDVWVVRLDEEGNIIWQKSYGGSGNDAANSIVQVDGGYIVVGYTMSSDGDVPGNHGMKDMWVVMLDENGNMLWQKTLGGSQDDKGYSAIQTESGMYVLVGYTKSNDGDVSENKGGADIWYVMLK